jgi:micrococcal nuclease
MLKPVPLLLLLCLLAACTVQDMVSTPTGELDQAAACVPQDTARAAGEVVDVIDGDTIDVRFEDGEIYRVRYIGVDTPERDEPFYRQSSDYNADLVLGQQVTLVQDVSETDRFGRMLAYVIVGDVFVNYRLVYDGYAQQVTFPPDVACVDAFTAAERQARENERGLWAP